MFREEFAGEVSRFMGWSGFSLVAKDDYFTFEDLEAFPDYSILGAPFMDLVAIETFEGKPWEVFEANEMVYDFSTGLVLPIASVTTICTLSQSGPYYISNGLILPGSITKSGSKIKSYRAWFSLKSLYFKYSEVTVV